MSNTHLSYLKERGLVWFNPCNGLNGFWQEYRNLVQKFPGKPHEYVWSHRDLKRAKEILAISIIAKSTEKQASDGDWLIIKPKNDPPDGVMGRKNPITQKMDVREIEVVEHINGEILDTIRKKLAGKSYEPNTVLVCYISKGGIHDFEKLHHAIAREQTSLDHIFCVFPGVKLTDIPQDASDDVMARALFKYSVVQLKPVYSYSVVDPIGDCADWRAGKCINFLISEGFGKGENTPITLENPPKLF